MLQKDPARRVPPGLPQAREVCFPDHYIMSIKNSTMTLRHKSVAKFLGREPSAMLLLCDSGTQAFSGK